MADLCDCARRDEMVNAALADEILAALCEGGVRPTALNVIHHAVEHGANDQLAAGLAELLEQRTTSQTGERA